MPRCCLYGAGFSVTDAVVLHVSPPPFFPSPPVALSVNSEKLNGTISPVARPFVADCLPLASAIGGGRDIADIGSRELLIISELT